VRSRLEVGRRPSLRMVSEVALDSFFPLSCPTRFSFSPTPSSLSCHIVYLCLSHTFLLNCLTYGYYCHLRMMN
jgi:hypothetical protein